MLKLLNILNVVITVALNEQHTEVPPLEDYGFNCDNPEILKTVSALG